MAILKIFKNLKNKNCFISTISIIKYKWYKATVKVGIVGLEKNQ